MADLALLASQLEEVWMVVQADRVEKISTPRTGSSGSGQVVDLARLWGLTIASSEDRRALRLGGRTQIQELIVGQRVEVVNVPRQRIQEVPSFVAGPLRRGAITGILVLDRGIFYLVDLELLQTAREESARDQRL